MIKKIRRVLLNYYGVMDNINRKKKERLRKKWWFVLVQVSGAFLRMEDRDEHRFPGARVFAELGGAETYVIECLSYKLASESR